MGRKGLEIQADPAIAEQAKRIGDQRTRWAQELGKRNIEEANKRAELLRAQAGRLQAEIDRTGHTKKNYSANFLNALLLGIMLIGFLGMAFEVHWLSRFTMCLVTLPQVLSQSHSLLRQSSTVNRRFSEL